MSEQGIALEVEKHGIRGEVVSYNLACKVRAMLAVTRRELTIYIRYPSWIIAMFVWPVLLPLQYIFGGKALAGPDSSGLQAFAQYSGTTDYVGFIALGAMLWMWMNMVLWDFGSQLRNEQIRGTLESNWLSPIPRILMLAGSGISSCMQHTFVILLSLVEFYLLLGVGLHGSALLIALIILLTMPTIYGLGLIFASLVVWAKEVNNMVFLVRGIMMIFCGVTFPLTIAPAWMLAVAKWIPMTYAIHSFRAVYLAGAGFAEIRGDLVALLIAALILMSLGVIAFHFTLRLVKRKGNLGVY